MLINIDLLFNLCLTLILVYFVFRIVMSKNRLAVYVPFLAMVFFTLIWWTSYMLYFFFPHNECMLFFVINIGLTGIIGTAASFLITALTHSKQKLKPVYWTLYIVPLSSLFVLWTNSFHKLFIVKYSLLPKEMLIGPYYFVHTIYSYFCLIAAFIILSYSSWKKGNRFKKLLLFLGMVLILLVSALITFKIVNIIPNTTLYTTVFFLLFYWRVMFKYDFLNDSPQTMKKIAEQLSDALAVVNDDYHIIEYNQAFASFFHVGNRNCSRYAIGLESVFRESFPSQSEHNEFMKNIVRSLAQKNASKFEQHFSFMDKVFLIEITPLCMERNRLGTAILFKDITAYKKLLAKITNQNEALMVLNEKLRNYATTVKELILQREKNRLEREIHNILGHNLNVVLRLLEVTRYTIKDDPEKAFVSILEAESTVKEAITNSSHIARDISITFKSDCLDGNTENSLRLLEVMNDKFSKKTGIQVVYWCKDDFSRVHHNVLNVIYNICQEAMTNALKHGKAKTIVIILKHQEGNIYLSVMNDGVGCINVVKSGIGLQGMEQMVKECSGNIRFKTNVNEGFEIHVVIPAENHK